MEENIILNRKSYCDFPLKFKQKQSKIGDKGMKEKKVRVQKRSTRMEIRENL